MPRTISKYDQLATDLLNKLGMGIDIQNAGQAPAPWVEEHTVGGKPLPTFRWAITISRRLPVGKGEGISFKESRLLFDFFTHKEIENRNGDKFPERPTNYDILACIGMDATVPETFEEFCADFGYDEDSRKAEKTYKQCAAHTKKLRAYFSPEELQMIQNFEND